MSDATSANDLGIMRSVLRILALVIALPSLLASVVITNHASAVSTKVVTCTVLGTNGNDTINGTAGNDIICGLGGNDVINGLGGNDIIDSGSGNDRVDGGAGNDTMTGNEGADTLNGGGGTDTANGGSGNDVLNGGAGNDTTNGGDGIDTANGGSGNDVLNGGAGNDKISGGVDDDVLTGGTGSDTLDGGPGLNICNVDSRDVYEQNPDVATCDIGAPRIKNVQISTNTIDTSSEQAVVSLTYTAVDDLAGFSEGGCNVGMGKVGSPTDMTLHGQSVANTESENRYGPVELSYSVTVSFPPLWSQGHYAPIFSCTDAVGNLGQYSVPDGFTPGTEANMVYQNNLQTVQLTGEFLIPVMTLEQTGIGDEEAPRLIWIEANRDTINTSAGPQTVHYTARITDDLAIAQGAEPSFTFASEQRASNVPEFDPGFVQTAVTSSRSVLTEGDLRDGIWSFSVEYPRFWPSGTTSLHGVSIMDNSGRTSRYGETFLPIPNRARAKIEQTGAGDEEVPVFESIELIGDPPNTRNGPDSFVVRLTLTDDMSGILWPGSFGAIEFVSATGSTRKWAYFGDGAAGRNPWRIISGANGNHRHVIVEVTITLPRLSALGQWNLVGIGLGDSLGRQTRTLPTFSVTNG